MFGKKHYLLNHNSFNSEQVLSRLCDYFDDVVLLNIHTGYAKPIKLSDKLEEVIGINEFDWNNGVAKALKIEVKPEDYEEAIGNTCVATISKMFLNNFEEKMYTYQDYAGIWRRLIFIPLEKVDKVKHVIVAYVKSKEYDLEKTHIYAVDEKQDDENLLFKFAVEDMYKAIVKIDLSSWNVTFFTATKEGVKEDNRMERWDVSYNDFMTYVESKNIQEVKDALSPHALLNAEIGEVKSVSFAFSGYGNASYFEEITAIVRVVYEGDTKVAIIYVIDETKKIRKQREHEYRINQELHRERQFRRALLADSIGFFEVNLSRDMITKYKTHIEDDKLLDLPGQVGLKIPCAYSKFIEKCIEKGFVEKDEDLLKFYDIDHMFERYERGKEYASRMFTTMGRDGKKHYIKMILVLSKEPISNDLVAILVAKDMSKYIQEEEKEID